MRRRIVLFHPRTFHQRNYAQFWVPYSLVSIASQLDPGRYEVRIIDNNLEEVDDFSEFSGVLRGADLVGITTMLGKQVKEALLFAEAARHSGDAPIVVGGPAAMMAWGMLLDCGRFDYVVSGQGELSFRPLVESLLEGGPPLDAVPNLHYARDGERRSTPNAPPAGRDAFSPYNFDLVPVQRYIARDAKIADRVLNYVSSQGCRWKCGFCSDTRLYQNRWVSEDVQSVVRVLRSLQERFGIDGVKFYDSNFAVRGERVLRFCHELGAQGVEINWAASIHPQTLYQLGDEELRMLKASRCKRLLIGAESGDDQVLSLMRKGLRVSETLALARRLADVGLTASYTFVVGIPGVRVEHYDATLALAEQVLSLHDDNEVKVHFYLPFPGTPLAPRAVAHGWRFPGTIQEWADIDYYEINAGWVPQEYRARVRALNVRGCPSVMSD
jgi:radical SAM superfamily enzyme YgiQ (UPF0313 family)